MSRVFITGLGFITSIGNDAVSVTERLRAMQHGLALYEHFQKDDVPVKVLGTIKGFSLDSTDQEDWTLAAPYVIKRDLIRSMSPNCVYAWCAMQQAIADAKLNEADISNLDTGLYAASGGSPYMLGYMLNRMNTMGVMRCSPLGIVASIAGTLNFNLVAHLKIKGASCGYSSACASSSHALGFAYDEIALGRQKRMFVVGAEDCNRESILPFAGMRALSLQKDPNNASRPFDSARDGFVGTGGATVLVLESEEEVSRRGAKVYCEVAGWGQASDGHNVAISHPEGSGLSVAIHNALKYTRLLPEQISYINAHATSTPIGDLSEIKAIKTVFGPSGSKPAISSTKALTGHGLSLAGAMESAFCALAIKEGFKPGSANITKMDPACEGLNILTKTEDSAPEIVLNNSSGFGGANVSVVLKKA